MHGAQLSPSPPASIAFCDWKGRIETAPDVDQLVSLVRAYLGAWKPEQLSQLPYDLAAVALHESDDILYRALLASRAELTETVDAAEYAFLREMALTFATAATRLRLLRSLRHRE